MQNPFKLKNAALLMALAAVYPMTAHSAAGIAQFTTGDVNVRRGNAAAPLSKGQPIESGDSIVTGGAGQAQIRFTDGGLVSLSPNSQFNISNYADANDPDKDSFAVSLFRGGMRAITGLIGKRNRDNYKVTTNTATIGIRGSAFSASYNADGSLNVAGEQDSIQVCTQAGCVDLTVGEIARVTSSTSLPSRTALGSNLPPLALLFQTGARKNDPEPELPAEVSLNGVLPGVSAIFYGYDEFSLNGTLVGGADPSTGVGTFVSSLLTKHVSTGEGDTLTFEQVGTTSTSFGTLGTANDPALIGWGHWAAAKLTLAGESASVEELADVHFIVGRPAPFAQMPISGSATYSLAGGTAPTANGSSYGGHSRLVGELVGGALNVNFSSGLLHTFVDTRFVKDGSTVNVQIGDFGYVSGNQFYSDGSGDSYFTGFFTGAQASRAGLVYYGYDDTVGDINGAAVFVKSGTGFATNEMKALFTDGRDELYNESIFPVDGPSFLVGNQLLMHGTPGSGGYGGYGGYSGGSFLAATGPVTSSGGIGQPSDPNFVGWGYWAKGSVDQGDGTYSLRDVHYIVGRPTINMPTTGTALYTMVGGTAPTARHAGVSIVGSLVSATMAVDFAISRVTNASVRVEFTKSGTQTVDISANNIFISGARFCAGDSTISGMFIGDNAIRAGIVYQKPNVVSNGINLGMVSGAVGLQRGVITPSVPAP